MATTQYIGARYVPILADPVEWSAQKTYEPLTIVTHEGNSYTSRQFVPQGIDIDNENYWALTGNYNAQVEQYRRETEQAVNQVNEWLTDAQSKYGLKSFAFDTVADMQRAYATLYDGAICHTNGFRTIGDNGGAWYVISDTGTVNDKDVLECGPLFANLVTNDEITVDMFGAYGDGSHDDYEVIAYCVEFASTNNKKLVFSKKEYLCTNTVNIGNIDVEMNGPIVYNGSSNAIVIGSQSGRISKHNYTLKVESKLQNYAPNSIGVLIYNATNVKVKFDYVDNFNIGVKLVGYEAGVSYNAFDINMIENCPIGIQLSSEGTRGWVNENYFYNGRITVNSTKPYAHTFIGIQLTSTRNYSQNANVFNNMSIEGAAVCVDIVYGDYNRFYNFRSEGAALAMRVQHKSNCNYMTVTYGTTVFESDAPMNTVYGYLTFDNPLPITVFDSGFIPDYSYSSANYLYCGKYIFYIDNGQKLQIYKGVKHNDYIELGNRHMAIEIDTSIRKRFKHVFRPYNGVGGRCAVIMFDADGNVLNDGIMYNSNRPMTPTTIGGLRAFTAGSDSWGSTYFEVPENCKKIYVVTSAQSLTGFVVLSDDIATVTGNNVDNGLSAIPTCEGKIGDICPSSAANIKGWRYNGTDWVEL